LRDKLDAIDGNYLDIQKDFSRRLSIGQLENLQSASLGLKLDNPRQLALMHALVRLAQIAAAGTFSTCEIHPNVTATLSGTAERYSLSSLRYDLSKLRAKGLVEKLPRSRRYRLPAKGYSVCLIFLKLVDRIYAPPAAGLLSPVAANATLPRQKRSLLDRLYQRLTAALDRLTRAIGLASSLTNENEIPVGAPEAPKRRPMRRSTGPPQRWPRQRGSAGPRCDASGRGKHFAGISCAPSRSPMTPHSPTNPRMSYGVDLRDK
jgi:hypothetical protein